MSVFYVDLPPEKELDNVSMSLFYVDLLPDELIFDGDSMASESSESISVCGWELLFFLF